jgi:uncharacterized membrane protein YraQ (UPF0718 family)
MLRAIIYFVRRFFYVADMNLMQPWLDYQKKVLDSWQEAFVQSIPTAEKKGSGGLADNMRPFNDAMQQWVDIASNVYAQGVKQMGEAYPFYQQTLDKMGGAKEVKRVRLVGGEHEEDEIPIGFKSRLIASFWKAWGDFKGVFLYMIIGVGIGAAIYGYLPADLLAKVAGPDNPFAVFVVALIGIPLYLRVESVIPIGIALMDKGASIGAVMALIISGAGIAIPELTMFASIFKKKIIIAFVIIVFITAVLSGLIFNLLI